MEEAELVDQSTLCTSVGIPMIVPKAASSVSVEIKGHPSYGAIPMIPSRSGKVKAIPSLAPHPSSLDTPPFVLLHAVALLKEGMSSGSLNLTKEVVAASGVSSASTSASNSTSVALSSGGRGGLQGDDGWTAVSDAISSHSFRTMAVVESQHSISATELESRVESEIDGGIREDHGPHDTSYEAQGVSTVSMASSGDVPSPAWYIKRGGISRVLGIQGSDLGSLIRELEKTEAEGASNLDSDDSKEKSSAPEHVRENGADFPLPSPMHAKLSPNQSSTQGSPNGTHLVAPPPVPTFKPSGAAERDPHKQLSYQGSLKHQTVIPASPPAPPNQPLPSSSDFSSASLPNAIAGLGALGAGKGGLSYTNSNSLTVSGSLPQVQGHSQTQLYNHGVRALMAGPLVVGSPTSSEYSDTFSMDDAVGPGLPSSPLSRTNFQAENASDSASKPSPLSPPYDYIEEDLASEHSVSGDLGAF